MTAQLSRERLEAKIKHLEEVQRYRKNVQHVEIGFDLNADEKFQLEAYRILLAGMDSEPLAVIDKEGNRMTRAECNDDRVFAICCKAGTPLYAAPPAQVAVPECFVRFHRVIKERHHGRMPEEVQEAFDECDAMLKAGPVTGWIKCSERMPPENDQDIWLWNGSVQSGYIWNGDRFVDWNEEYQELRGVTHWMPMPLPAAPEQEV